ncbi:hypothetical protein KEM56_007643 [Ascosphaera pollenicola]|nr:hypothetical protein KEM56_007643 [Ascosphaera pollenicola]
MAKEEEVQCEGLTKKKTRCTRSAAVSNRYRGRVLCWQHMKEAKGGESDSDDRDFIEDDDEEYADEFLGSEEELIAQPKPPKPSRTPRRKKKPSQSSKASTPSRPPSSKASITSRPQSSRTSLTSRPQSTPKPSKQHSSSSASIQKPPRKVSSTDELFDSFGRMNLVNDIPPESAVSGKKKEYSLFGGRVKVTRDSSGQGAHLNFALNLSRREKQLKNKLFHRHSSADYDADAGPVAPDPNTYNGTSVPLSLPQTTADYFNWIPKHISPETAQKLLREVLVPVSARDVPGYIYMCWVTPDVPGHDKPSRNWASKLIPSARDDECGQTILPDGSKVSTAEVMKAAGVPPETVEDNSGTTRDCIILKIGRAVNVEQRMKQWKDQCAHTLTLMRHYPYFSGQPLPDVFSDEPTARSASLDNSKIPRDRIIPHCHKVEHLIHVELDEMRVRYQKPCSHCGQKHQEWFEIPAEASKIRMVHECISKWTRWSQMMAEEMEKNGERGFDEEAL